MTNVKLEYSTDGGSSWTQIVGNTSAPSGSYSWTVPGVSSTTCLVRITDTANANITDQSDAVFTIINPTITVTSPNGGETLLVETALTITWTSTNVDRVRIEFSSDGGTNWDTIDENFDAGAGSYSWSVPEMESADCLVKVTDTTDSSVDDVSDGTFTITSGDFISVISPESGDRLPAGSEYDITWEYHNISDVTIAYSIDDGANWQIITESVSALTGSYRWLVPEEASQQCKVRISDVSDASLVGESPVFEIFVPEIQLFHEPIFESPENEPLTFDATLTGEITVDNPVVLHYDVTGRRVFDKSLEMESSDGSSFSATLGAGVFTTMGIEYYFTVLDENDRETRLPAGSGFYSICAVVPHIQSAVMIEAGTEVSGYRMISVPLELSTDSITEQLAETLPDGKMGTDWRLFRFLPGSATPGEYPDIEGFSPGMAFWLITRNDFRLKTLQGTTVTTAEPFTIILNPGWNDIANPWMFDISWDDIENPSGAQLSVLYAYEGHWLDPTSPPAVLEPWKGYAVNNLSNTNALIKLKPKPGGSAAKPFAGEANVKWMLTINASAAGAMDSANHLGVHSDAAVEWDRYDHVEPPPVGRYVSVSFPHPDWQQYPADYTVDFRPPANTLTWDVTVTTNIPRETVAVQLSGMEQLPEDYSSRIYDLEMQHWFDENITSFGFVSGNDITERHFRIVVSNSQEPEEDNFSRPERFVTAHCFPNPFNNQTTIQYEISRAAHVTITVYNMVGQQVQVFHPGQKEPGIHEILFDAKNLTSGIYFYRLDAGYGSVTGKMLYMK